MSQPESRDEVLGIWCGRLRKAEQRYRLAVSQAEKLQAEYELSPSAELNLALAKALKAQCAARDEDDYVLRTFTRLAFYGEAPEETTQCATREPLATIYLR